MESIWNTILGSTVALVVVIGLLSSIVYLGRTWVSERIAQSVAHAFSVRFEQFKNEISEATAQRMEVQSAANAVLLTTHRVAAEQRIKAVDALWREIIEVRKVTANALTMLDILVPSEYQDFVTRKDLRDLIPRLDDHLHILDDSIEHVRPFLRDNLFSQFFLYRATLGRIWALLEKGITEGEVKPWFEDELIRRNLRQLLSPQQMAEFESRTAMHLMWTRSLIEGNILKDLREEIAGTQSTAAGIEQADKIREAVESMRLESQERALERSASK